MTIGIFDSGMGGLTVLATAQQMMPGENFIYYGDTAYAPYGIQSIEYILERSRFICDLLLEKGVDAIVIACNTATSAAVKILRKEYTIPIIGMEPAIKPAIEKNNGLGIIVMATPLTLKEEKYRNLVNQVMTSQKIYEVPAPDIVTLVESGMAHTFEMEETIKKYFKEIPMESIESIVLGCTHFLFIKNLLKALYPHVELIDGNEGTINQLKRKIRDHQKKMGFSEKGKIEILNSAGEKMILQSEKLLKEYILEYGN
ncbi:MAG: glutamate racemase [Clostridia bacterium]|nr:glutamate racemase [Clostridia bacterium]